jgi:ABC-type molybdate transport system substrate-binding protein
MIFRLTLSCLAAAVLAVAAPGWTMPLQCTAGSRPACLRDDQFPPWQHGANSDVTRRGLEFTVPDADDLADFHGALADPRLVLFVGGNIFFAYAPLVQAFEAAHPEYAGRLYWETLPPGLLAEQMRAGGTITVGNMTWTVRADAYLAGLAEVRTLATQGVLDGPPVAYATNTLTIMVPAGNPGHVTGLGDLARPGLQLAMPNPAFEGIARQIKTALARAGGTALVDAVYQAKVQDGSTMLTRIHHRQTPLFLMQGLAEAGVTWQSEAAFQEQVGHPISHVAIPEAQNATGIYAGAVVHGARHRAAAALWLDFLRTPTAQDILARYGFRAYQAGAGE